MRVAGRLGRELQNAQRLIHLLAADEIQYDRDLGGGHADVTRMRMGALVSVLAAGRSLQLHSFRHIWPSSLSGRAGLFAGVTAECAGRGKFTQLVADHILGDIDRHMLAAVVDGDGVADKVGENRGRAGPGLDDLLVVAVVELDNLLVKTVKHIRPFLYGSAHDT